MEDVIVKLVSIDFNDEVEGNYVFKKTMYGPKPGKYLSDNVSEIFKKSKKPWKVGEIRALSSWKKLQSSSNEDFLKNFKEFCDENDIFYCVVEFDRKIKVGPSYDRYFSDSVRSKVKLIEIELPEDVGGDKSICISNLNLKNLPGSVVRDAIYWKSVSFSIMDLTQESIDKMRVIASIRAEASKIATSEADIFAQKEEEKQKSDQRMANASFNVVLIAIAGFFCFLIFGFVMMLKSISNLPSGSYENSGGSMTINGESYTQQQFEDKLRSEAETLYDNCQAFGSGFSDKCP